MDLNQLRSFLSVSQTLIFTAAARLNNVPQSTISRQISDLESQLGVRLFYRTKRDVQLTNEGRAFLPYAQEILDAARKGTTAARQLNQGAAGRLSIATLDTSTSFLASCLRRFSARYPDIAVDLTYVSCGDTLQTEGEDPYDFHLLHRDMLYDSDEYFDSMVTHSDSLVLVVPKGHPLVGQPITGAALQREKFILVTEEESPIVYTQILDIFRSLRFSPQIINRYDRVKAVLLSVSAGLGITILPSATPREMLPDLLEIIPLPNMNTELVYSMAWKRSLLNPAARRFLDTVREIVNE